MKVIGLGQCCLDMLAVLYAYPGPDEKAEVVHWEEQSGGPVATALVTLSRLGIETCIFAIAGDDPEGGRLRQYLESSGVDVRGITTREHSSSQKAFIVIDRPTGRRTIFWRKPTGDDLRPDELPGNFPGECDFLHLDGLMGEVSLQAAIRARSRQIPVMLDAGTLRAKTLDIARNVDYLVGSELFARQIGWGSRDDFPESVLALGVRAATFTTGSGGSFTISRSDSFTTPAFPVDVADTTGAGDVFHGAYIYGLLQQWGLREVVRFATAAAAIKCTRIGGSAGAPTLKEIQELLAKKD